MKLKILEQQFSVCKISDDSCMNWNSTYLFFSKTDEELSLVCESDFVPENHLTCEPGWRAFRIEGMLDFSMIGVISKISAILADAQVGIFVVSTFNTDYIFVKEEQLGMAMQVLAEAGYETV